METFDWNFAGTNHPKLDAQGRFSLPADWRNQIERSGHKNMMAFLQWEFNPENPEDRYPFLVVYPVPQAKETSKRLQDQARAEGNFKRVSLVKSAYTNGDIFKWDTSGRVKISPSLLASIGVDSKSKGTLVVLGQEDTIKIRSEEVHERVKAIGDEPHPGYDTTFALGMFINKVGTDNSNNPSAGGAA